MQRWSPRQWKMRLLEMVLTAHLSRHAEIALEQVVEEDVTVDSVAEEQLASSCSTPTSDITLLVT